MCNDCQSFLTDKYIEADDGTATVDWDEPIFEDHLGTIAKVKQPGLLPGQPLQHGAYDIAYIAYDTTGNTAQCNFTVHVLKSICPPLDPPKNGNQKCEDWGPGGRFKVCRIECEEGYRFSQVSCNGYSSDTVLQKIIQHFKMFYTIYSLSTSHKIIELVC